MNTFSVLRTPKTIIYGRNSFQKAGLESTQYGKKVLIISDTIMKDLGYVKEAEKLIHECGGESSVYLGVVSEPTDLFVHEALEQFEKDNCDVIMALGGGSCIDTAKAVAVLAANGGYIGDYMGGKKIADQAPIPLIAIPTTAGTGSEATDVTIITNTNNDVKMMIKQPAFMPACAIIDPILTISSPKQITAATGIDALSHALEAYISRKAHPMTDMLALSAIKNILPHMRNVYEDGHHMQSREAMSLGSLQGGMAFSNASVCLVHGMSRPIGALFHVPHGISNAMLLPAVLEFSMDHCIERLADVGRIFSEDKMSDKEAAQHAIDEIKALCQELNIPNLKGWGIHQQAFEKAIPKMAYDAIASGSPGNNPKVPTLEEITELYKQSYTYSFHSTKLAAGGEKYENN
ncbi:iron-containing alcohol dehydrogenase [Bacillus sp. UMB0893]|uniref:iron-containing alcohol dehydrogenase n=1 Tax=Bacillus sp. UMB0893 TaxID=2066053 RepID=UPI000C77B533|nr:iron-containing alcohol dehydrogenase [Bacillus sp. UMB0893]PLR68755.1 alcohol dehydrogenase [Bacillus sp. UMB0893]